MRNCCPSKLLLLIVLGCSMSCCSSSKEMSSDEEIRQALVGAWYTEVENGRQLLIMSTEYKSNGEFSDRGYRISGLGRKTEIKTTGTWKVKNSKLMKTTARSAMLPMGKKTIDNIISISDDELVQSSPSGGLVRHKRLARPSD